MRSTYLIKELFGPTIQGEGTYAGSVVKFLRFAGCNKWTGLEKDRAKSMCSFCDTDFRGGTKMTAQEILTALDALGSCKTVVISGGEASLQLDAALLSLLTGAGYELHLETNGSKDLAGLAKYFAHITMSPKQSFAETKLTSCDDLKILYPAIHPEITMEKFSEFKAKERYLQPVHSANYENHLKATIGRLYGNPKWKLSLQLHKMIEVK